MHRFARRLPQATDALDVDAFNEALYEFGSESGRIIDQNCSEAILGTDETARLAHVARDAYGVKHVRESQFRTSGALPVVAGNGWTVVETVEITTRGSRLRVHGLVELSVAATRAYAGIRVNGVLLYESRIYSGTGTCGTQTSVAVPKGAHEVELVVQQWYDDPVSVVHSTLSVFSFEK